MGNGQKTADLEKTKKMFVVRLLLLSISPWIALGLDCSFSTTYPRQLVTYKVGPGTIIVDGKLDETVWDEVEWTDNFVDISSEKTPRLRTRAKAITNEF